jgi:hypothetical protein
VPIFPGERLAAIVPIGHRLAQRPAVRPGDLRQQDLLTVPRRIDPAVHEALIARVRDAGHCFAACASGAEAIRATSSWQ